MDHQSILQNVKMNYLTKDFVRKEKDIFLPYKFKLSWVSSFFQTLQTDTPRPVGAAKKMPGPIKTTSRFIACYFMNTETNIDIYKNLLKGVEKGFLDSKYLYWSLTGAKSYLSLCRNPNYDLPGAAHDLLAKGFKTQIYPIIEKSGRKTQHLIDLGPGNGQEVNIILSYLISRNAKPTQICCTLVDFSYHMLRIAVNTLDEANIEDKRYRRNVTLSAINSDIRDLHLYRALLKSSSGCRLFAFLGGTLGNFFERKVLDSIKKEMSEEDFLLLGMDLIGERSDEDLKSGYNSLYNKEFLFNPLADIGYDFERCDFNCSVRTGVSHVPNSRTVVSSFFSADKEIEMAISTKYDFESLEEYLKTVWRFHILTSIVNKRGDYAILLMTK